MAAVLFTDLVGSTAIRSAIGEEAADALRRQHDGMLSEAVGANGGRLVKGSGDGVLAAFTSATDALGAAVAAQQALWRYNQRRDRMAELSVRMGIAVGDVSWEDGDCFGAPVIEAARLEAAATGGQVLCTEMVRLLARGRGNHRFVDRGELTLKGLPEPVHTCEVLWDVPAPTSTAMLPPALGMANQAPLIGREAEVAAVFGALGELDRLKTVWLVGEPGIGKTRLAAAVAANLAGSGTAVLLGRCDEDVALPFQPFAEALRAYVADLPDPALLGADPAALARLAPAIGALIPDMARLGDDAGDQLRLFEAVVSWLAAASARQPLLVVVDDIQWAAAPTVQLLRFVVRQLGDAALGFLLTMRDTEAAVTPADGLLDEVAVRHGATVLRLGGLGTPAIVELVGTDERAASDLFDQTGGNPLFLTLLRGGGGDLASALRYRARGLSSAARELLAVAAVAGDEWELPVVALALARPAPQLLGDVAAIQRAGLVGELGVGRFRFGHALIRQALLTESGPTRVAALHLRLADALEEVHGGALDAVAGRLAYHLVEAVAVGVAPERAVAAALQAGRLAIYQFDHGAAVEYYSWARRVAGEAGWAERREYCEALLGEGQARIRTTDMMAGFDVLSEAVSRAEAGGWHDLAVPAAVEYSRMAAWLSRSGPDVAELLRSVEARVPREDAASRAMLLVELARTLTWTTEVASAGAVLEEGLLVAQEAGATLAEMHALQAHFHVYYQPQDRARRRAAVQRLVALNRGTGLLDPWAHPDGTLFEVELGEGNLQEAIGHFDAYRRVGDAYSFFQVELTYSEAMVHVALGRFAEAEACYERARQVAESMTGFDAEGIYGLQMFLLRRDQGRLGEVAAPLRMAARMGALGETWQPGLAALCAELGFADEARAVLDRLVNPDGVVLPEDSVRGPSLTFLIDAVAHAGSVSQASVLYQALAPWAGGCVIVGSVNACLGPADRYLGTAAATAGWPDRAIEHFTKALALCAHAQSPVWTAQTQLSYGEFLVGQEDVRAAQYLEAARAAAASVGMAGVVERASALLAIRNLG